MINNNKIRASYYQPLLILAALMASVFLALLTFIQPGAPLEPGLDSSWAYGLNYTFQHNLVVGRDIYFTFGPLGFLEHTRLLTISMVDISTSFWFACSIVMNMLIFFLCRAAAISKWQLVVNLCFGLLIILFANSHIQRILIICYAGVLLHWYNRSLLCLLLVSLVSVLTLLIKFSHGAVALSLYFPYLFVITLRDKNFNQVLIGFISLPVFYTLIWYGIYGDLAGAAGYLEGGLQFSRGSTSAMALNPDNNFLAIAGFYIAFLLGIAVIARSTQKKWILMPLCFLGPLFIWSKYAFGREDSAHLSALMSFVFYVVILWVIYEKSFRNKLACLLIIPLCFISWRAMHSEITGAAEFTPALSYYPVRTFKYRGKHEELMQIMGNRSKETLAPLALPTALRDTIGNSTVDIYPWETLIAAANDLNWTPRPVYQSYISYTPFLDSANQHFFDGDHAPEYIVWHYHSYADIGTRFPFSSDPLTLQSILQHYKMISCEGKFCLWQRTKEQQLSVEEYLQTSNVPWNSWVSVPDIDADAIRLHVDAEHTIAGKLNLAAWKEGGIEIDYRLRDGSIMTHEVVLDNAVSGLWASPYITSFYLPNKPQPVEKTQLTQWLKASSAEGYIENIEITSNGIHTWGWGLLPFKTSQTQKLSLLLYNDNNAYTLKLENKSRPGITEHFGKTGIVDLDFCGFNELFPHHNIEPGQYNVRFLVENEGAVAISSAPGTPLNIKAGDNNHDVEAIRLRTSRPWAFTDQLSLDWSGMTYTGERPW